MVGTCDPAGTGNSDTNADKSTSRKDATPAIPDRNRIQKSRVFTLTRILHGYEFNFKSRGHSVEGFAVDAEDFRCAFAIVAGGLEHVKDVASLYLVEIW